jgi:hypothetical protein
VRSGSNAEHVVSARSERNVVECDRSQVRGLRLLSAFQAIVEIADAKGYARAEKKIKHFQLITLPNYGNYQCYS